MTPVDTKHSEQNSFNQFVLHFRYLPDEIFLTIVSLLFYLKLVNMNFQNQKHLFVICSY